MQHDSIEKYPSYLEVMCATKLMQACGRTTRTPTDFSRTFVLERLPGHLKQHLQPWFRAAMQEVELYEVLGDEVEAGACAVA
jgi:Rad3-related DNA helicase